MVKLKTINKGSTFKQLRTGAGVVLLVSSALGLGGCSGARQDAPQERESYYDTANTDYDFHKAISIPAQKLSGAEVSIKAIEDCEYVRNGKIEQCIRVEKPKDGDMSITFCTCGCMRVHTKNPQHTEEGEYTTKLMVPSSALRDEEIFVTNDRGHFILEKKDSGDLVFFVTQSRLKAAYVNPDPAEGK